MAGIFLNENVAQGLTTSPNNTGYQAGISDIDPGQSPDNDFPMPWLIDPDTSWMDYNCWIEPELDSGIVVHRALPQEATDVDSLGVAAVNSQDFDEINDRGVNLISKAKFTDTIQRMATSHYRFCLKGWARRAGYQIPIPNLLTVAGVPAIPDDQQPQRGVNMIVGNNSGIPIWFARWELWYTVSVPPKEAQKAPENLAMHIGEIEPGYLPTGIAPPVSTVDSLSFPSGPVVNPDFDLPTAISNE